MRIAVSNSAQILFKLLENHCHFHAFFSVYCLILCSLQVNYFTASLCLCNLSQAALFVEGGYNSFSYWQERRFLCSVHTVLVHWKMERKLNDQGETCLGANISYVLFSWKEHLGSSAKFFIVARIGILSKQSLMLHHRAYVKKV